MKKTVKTIVRSGFVLAIVAGWLFVDLPFLSQIPQARAATNYRSIGTGGIIYQTGTASCSANTTVTFSGTLPTNVGQGDKLTIDVDGTPETGFIVSRDSDTQVTLQSALSGTYTNQDFKIKRAYATLQAWEDDRDGVLTAVEVGVAYNDGTFLAGVTIDDSTTSSSDYMWLTVAEGHRHNGRAGTGVKIDPTTAGDVITVSDSYTIWEYYSGLSDGTWYYSVFVHTYNSQGKGYVYLYRNGSDIRGNSCWGKVDMGDAFDIGRMGGTDDRNFDGKIDEVRFSNERRSANWVATSHNSMKLTDLPGRFYTLGEETTLVELSSFTAKPLNSRVLLEWETAAELDTEGFNVLRSEEEDGEYVKINRYLIPSKGEAGFGAEYRFTDYDVENGVTYYYPLEDVDFYGVSTLYGPVSATPNDIILIWPIE